MKAARDLSFAGIADAQAAVRYLLRIRFAECLEKQHALDGDDDEAIHAFRLACKRLRYAIERMPAANGQLKLVVKLLSDITRELGSAHDCAVLASRASNCNADRVVRLATADRMRYLRRGSHLWRRAFDSAGALEPLAEFTGFRWLTD